MKIKGFLAGLGIAGKVALGVGVAAAATTGAGAAGVLPGPVQHAVSSAVDAVSPFTMPDGDHHEPKQNLADGDGTTTTTVGDSTTTTLPKEHDGKGDHKGDKGDGNGIVTPTTVGEHHGDGTTTTTVKRDNGSHDGNGSNDGTNDGTNDGNGDGHETTPTTVKHGDGDNNNPQALSLSCHVDGAGIKCSWGASTIADHHVYVLLRSGGTGNGRLICSTEDGLTCPTDNDGVPGTEYHYLVDSLRSDGTVSSHSNFVTLHFPGEPTTTTTVHHEGDGTTTTTTGDH